MRHAWIMALALVLAAGRLAGQTGSDPFTAQAAFVPAGEGGGELTVRLEVPAGHYLYDEMLSVSADAPVVLQSTGRPEAELYFDKILETNQFIHRKPVALTFRVSGVREPAFAITVESQGCSGDICFLPVTRQFRLPAKGGVGTAMEPQAAAGPAEGSGAGGTEAGFRIRARAEGYLGTEAFLAFLKGGPATGGEAPYWKRWMAGGGVLAFLVILIGGLLLNLTPCVLPLIPVNLALIGAGAKSGSRGRGFALGACYGLGMAVAYGLLGLVVVLTGTVFGTLNASPWFNLAFAILFILLALAAFGVFNLDFSRFQPSSLPNGRTRRGASAFALAFLLGGLSALLAGACVAPVVVAVLAHAAELYSGGSKTGLLMPFLLGLGMALPWPLAGAGMAVLPKPGRWMLWVKTGIGVVILLLAFNYAKNAWTGFRWQSRPVDSRAALEQALKRAAQSGKPVFVDFWATWCKACMTMEETTFRQERVKRALEGFEVVKFQAERLDDPAVRPVLERYGVKGLPSYLVLEKDSE